MAYMPKQSKPTVIPTREEARKMLAASIAIHGDLRKAPEPPLEPLVSKQPLYVCSCRAEYPGDEAELRTRLWSLRDRYSLDSLKVTTSFWYGCPTLNPCIEISSDTIPFEEIKKIILGIPDGHIMLQSLRPLPAVENSMERDHSINWDTGEKDDE